ncbi:MAG: hypothetical protein H7Y36_11440, partial [Armatimonadetes bacterium]|nr:hypothetical protein [Akkermansiaceae bacterium]
MSTDPLSLRMLRKLPPFALIALMVCPACSRMPISPRNQSQPSFAGGERQPVPTTKPSQSPLRRAQRARPDPRFRPPVDFAELQAVAGEVARTSGRKIRWRLALGDNPGPLARISGGLDDCTIYLHPVAARKVPPNTWAFI